MIARARPSLALSCASVAILICVGACRTAAPKEGHESHRAPSASVHVANRDPHADPDTQQYIARLESAERRADLQIERVVETLAMPTDAMIGDLGCGPGLFAIAFARACPAGVVYASDLEPAQLDRVRERVRAEGVKNVVPVLASLDDPHFPPGRLDMVFVADTYHHLGDRVRYFTNVQSTLKPGGRLVILEYKPGELPVGPPPEHKLALGVLERELTEAGYTPVERFDTHEHHDFEVWRVLQPWERR